MDNTFKNLIALFVVALIGVWNVTVAVLVAVAYLIYIGASGMKFGPKLKLKTYIIKQGRHYSTGKILGMFNFGVLFKDDIYSIDGRLIIHESMSYNDIAGWNKVVGFNGTGVVKNPYAPGYIPRREVYLVWRCDNKKIKLGAYARDFGKIIEQPFTIELKPYDQVQYKVAETNDMYVINIERLTRRPELQVITLPKTPYKTDMRFRLKSYPYFGGRQVAPHDIKIQIIK